MVSLSVYDETVNLNGTVYICHGCCLSDLCIARPLVCLAVASCVDMGLGGANICYLTQINAQTERGGKWSSKSFRNWLKRRRLENQF